ncbi:MAG: helix-turn-helix transcriptional regulator [Clostridia bacterium]|nr:helix-turn-helix transcriptional regulator [Clostridia bacterium]
MSTENKLSILCKNIKFLREKNNLTKTEMARMLHIGIKSLSRIEKGDFPPKISCLILFRLYYHFGISPTDLLRTPLFQNGNK